MHRWIVLILLLVPALALAAEPADIAVVETWDDLAKRPAIQIENTPDLRVGIESRTMERFGGVLVYLLLDGDQWATPADREDGMLGPLTIRVESEHRVVQEHAQAQILRQVRNAEWAGADQILFVAPVVFEPGGRLTVSLIHGEKTVIARTTVLPIDKDAHPWFAFTRGDGEHAGLNVGDEMVESVRPVLTQPAVPDIDGDRPFDWVRKGDDVDPDRPLPRLIPAEGPALNVTVRRVREHHELTVKFPEQVMTATIAGQLVARWWVDGQPVISPVHADELEQLQEARRFMRSDTLKLRLEIPDGSFGDFGGERVQVEIMYCPDGVKSSGEMQQQMMMEQMFVHGQKQRQRVPMRSNRVEFRMPHKFAMR